MDDGAAYDLAYRGEVSVKGVEDVPTNEGHTLGRWPRMLNFDEEVESRLAEWIISEITAYNLERQPLLEDWIKWQNQYWAEPAEKVKNFPFERSANIVIPLSAIAVEAVHARIMNTLFSVEPFWSIRPRAKEWIAAAKPFESFLQSEVDSSETLRVYEFCNDSSLELTKLGTCIGKSGYERYTKKSLRRVGTIDEEFFVTIRNGATIGRVPLGNFIMRFSELDTQTAPLVGERHEFSWSQLKQMAQDGRMSADAVEKIRSFAIQEGQDTSIDSGGQLEESVEQLSKAEPKWADKFDVYEIWASFDVDGDGIDEEIVLDFHLETKSFLSARYNWYDDLHRPYRINNYINVEGIWPGLGVCKQVEQMQEEVTTIHRQRLDNATLANMSQIVVKKGTGYESGEPIFPGKMWFLDDPGNDIFPFSLSEIYPSGYINEENIVSYYEKRTGANEVILGVPQQGTPGTATSDLTRLAEGNKRFDLVLKNTKRWLSKIGIDIVVNYQIFGDQQVHWIVLGEDGVHVDQVLQMPSTLVRRGAIIDLTVTDTITNRQVEQQNWMSLFQVVSGFYAQAFQSAQVLAEASQDPSVLFQTAERALVASNEALIMLLETFGVVDSDRFALTPRTGEGEESGNQPPTDGSLEGSPGGGPAGDQQSILQ